MKISKIFHFLYFSILSIPLFSGAIFAIYSMNHEITGYEVTQSVSKQVDYNNLVDNVNYNAWTSNNNVITKLENGYILTATQNVTAGDNSAIRLYSNIPNYDAHHIYLVNFYFYSSINASPRFEIFRGLWSVNLPLDNTNYYQYRFTMNSTIIEEYNLLLIKSNSDMVANDYYEVSDWQLIDLTQMFGSGNEPSIEEYNNYLPNYYESFTLSKKIYIENYSTETYNDTDIMSQFMYCEYNFMDKYLPMYKYAPFDGIYQWIQNTFFGGASPLVFTVIYQWFAYWLLVSLFWLIFDVLIYVPMVIHRWLDKGALE